MRPLSAEAAADLRRQLRALSSPRIWTPAGLVSPVDVAWAQRLTWSEGFALFDPQQYRPDQWRHLMRLRARKWLEDGDRLPVTGALFLWQLGTLAAGKAQSFLNKDFGDSVAVMLTISSPPVTDLELALRPVAHDLAAGRRRPVHDRGQ